MVVVLSAISLLVGNGAVGAPAAAQATSTSTASPLACDGQWHTVPSVDPQSDYGDFDSLVSVSALTATDAWAIGSEVDFDQPPYGYRTLAEHWDGTSWSAVSMPNPDGSTWNEMQAVTALASNDVWAVGSEGYGPYKSLIEHWDGTSWSIQNVGMPKSYLTSVSALGPNDVWVAGSTDYPGTGLVMHWDGTQWTRTLIPGAFVFRGIDELSPNDIWAVGQESTGGFGDRSAAYHFDGRQWLRYDTPNPLGKYEEDQNWLTSVHAVSSRDIWVTGVARDIDWGIPDHPFTVHWDGKQWSFVATPDPGGSTANTDLWGTVAFGSNDVWAAGRVGDWPDWKTFTSHWDGSSWTQSASTTAGEFLATSADGAGGMWAVGDRQLPEANGTVRDGTLIEHMCPSGSSPSRATATPATAARASTTRTAAATQKPLRHLCAQSQKPGYAGCFAIVGNAPPRGQAVTPQTTNPAGYGPADLQDAYKLPSAANGSGQTVGIVDAFDDPTAAADLATYRAQYGLPPCKVDNGCLRKVDQRGGAGYPQPDPNWAGEISLDLDMVSAICPNCHILLVEADDNSMDNLGAAVNEAVALGAKFVSNSYGGPEDPSEITADTSYFHHPGVAITASSGDYGYGVEYPAASQYVTSVGGTSLVRDASSRGWAETAWSGAGSGCSAYVAKPSWQTDTGCGQRSVADVSAVADSDTPVALYDSYSGSGWMVAGGTSVSSPIIAATYALAGTPAATSQPNSFPYAAPATAFNDVTSGDNGVCTPTYLCSGGPGYDGPTGLGTPNGIAGFAPNGPHGDIAGTITDQVSHAPLVNAKVSAGGLVTYTDKTGHYDLFAPAGSYTVTVAQYGYQPQSIRRVTVTQDHATTEDFALSALPTHTVSGTVTDGSGHGWPLYAQITIDGTPGGPIWTDPATGHYSVSLPVGTYTMHVSASYPGYQTRTVPVSLAASDVVVNVSVPVDQNTCAAPGYQFHYHGTTQTFDNAQAPTGWSVASAGTGKGWTFGNPGTRDNTTGGDGNFAIVDSDYDGFGSTEDASLISPSMDLTADPSPIVQFAQDFFAGVDDTTAIDVSTNGGHTWTTVATQVASQPGPTTTAIAIPQAAGKQNVRIRFHYQTQSWTWWWAVDNVFIGNRSCDPSINGGLVVGAVTDTGNAPIEGATVANVAKPAETATTASSDDPAIPGGFYWLFVPETGTQSFSASATGYQSQTRTTQVVANGTVRADFTLSAVQPPIGP